MDFFENQASARKRTGLLVFYFVLAVILIVLSIYLLFALIFLSRSGGPHEVAGPPQLWHPEMFLWVTGGTLLVVLTGTLYKLSQLSEGGAAVARMLGGKPIPQNTTDPDERKVLNVVEEMSIASGSPMPQVFLLGQEDGINAFAAGVTPRDAVIGVTAGCIRRLNRAELQGVIAHEFSHILNGDMRLNLRLLGVLNGILIIALAGFWLMRSMAFAPRRRSSRDRGSGMAFLLLGLGLMAVGAIGVFFGKLIKSAVSRQREFLADASAVQFTRNPDGIAGALKKIGGFKRGSVLKSTHAEEASHLFFCNGLSGSLARLMATHPPLPERIRRIDPSFSGRFDAAPPVPPRARATQAGPPPPPAFAETASGFSVSPGQVSSAVGTLSAQHLSRAHELVERIPVDVAESAREMFGARAVLYALVLDEDAKARERQTARLRESADEAVFNEFIRLAPAVRNLGPELRLPLMDIAVSALKDISEPQYRTFSENLEVLVRADEQVDLFEYVLRRAVDRHLEPLFTKARRPVRGHALKTLLPACRDLLSCLAYWGADEMPEAQAAFDKGWARLGEGGKAGPMPLNEAGLAAFDAALNKLETVSLQGKRKIIEAATACIGADGRVTAEEAEMLRAVADALDCPLPPFLRG